MTESSRRLKSWCPVSRILPTVLLVCVISGLLTAGLVRGDEGSELGSRAWQAAGDFPWYDAESQSSRPIEMTSQGPLRQSSDWEWAPASPTTSRPFWNFGNWQGFWDVVQVLVWILLAGIFVVLIYLWLSTVARNQLAIQRRPDDELAEERGEAALIEQLPFQVKRPQTDLLGEARRHYQTGNYREAMIYLYSYQLVQLDRHQRIRLAKGKTNRQYLFELRSAARLRQMLTPSMLAFEDVFFGHYDLPRERFERCWQQLEEFESLLPETVAVS